MRTGTLPPAPGGVRGIIFGESGTESAAITSGIVESDENPFSLLGAKPSLPVVVLQIGLRG